MSRLIRFGLLQIAFALPSVAQLSGSYTVGTGGDYLNLAVAFTALNTSGASASVTFLVISDITELTSPGLTTTTLNSSTTLTVKPDVGVTATITLPVTESISMSGSDYVTIDGSNSGGTSRNLTIKHSASGGSYVLTIGTGCTNVTVKNCILGDVTNTPVCAVACSRCSDVTIQNNDIHGIGSDFEIISLFRVKGSSNFITENVISGDQASSGTATGIGIADTTGTVTISKNRLHTLQTSSNGPSDWIVGMMIDNAHGGIFKIYNNFIGGNFVSTGSAPYYFLLSLSSNASSEVYHNTLVLNSVSGTVTEAANFRIDQGTSISRNNIVLNSHNVAESFCVANYLSSPTDLTSNENNLVASGGTNSIGLSSGGSFKSLSDWQGWSGVTPDLNSVSTSVTFTNSASDFHLAGGSVGDSQLRGTSTTLGVVPDDIDGESRLTNPDGPYMGADEGSVALPVQLASFTAISSGSSAILRWVTVSEVNCLGFEIERRGISSIQNRSGWQQVAFIQGAGTSTVQREYSYEDAMLLSGRYSYRIKQIDQNGSSVYTESMELEVGTAPKEFTLAQNYPNPFNPTTVIDFTLEEDGPVRLTVYDILGRELTTLLNEEGRAGVRYQVPFDASRFGSGVFFYRLEGHGRVLTKRMIMMK